MAGSVDPPDGGPDGTPEGLPGGGEDEYRSVVFDESFVRAARLQEFSAQERLGENTEAVRSRPRVDPALRPGTAHGTGRSALVLALIVAMVFAAAVYLGIRTPYRPPPDRPAEPLRTTLIALVPRGEVPGGRPAQLYADSPAAQFPSGAAGINLPPARRTAHFSEGQVVTALSIAKDYLVLSSLDPDVLSGGSVRPVRLLVDPEQLGQFDRSIDSPADDGHHAPAGWLVRFDPAQVTLADTTARVRGTMSFTEASTDTLEVTSDHTFAYAVRPTAGPGGDSADASLFTVRRELTFRFDREDLRMHRAELLTSHVQAGPQDCRADAAGTLRPLLAGGQATAAPPEPIDPYATGRPAAAPLCGTLAPQSQP
ncbi:hypothetical protein [Streptomyces sp. NPDC047928]|uniref:SCO2583 family membrane protein n=1 Tax=unclassified Streptomyces TaxID=2593676 RepID=UPI00371197CF